MALGTPTLGPRDAAYYRRLGDDFAEAASRSAPNDPTGARQLMLAARDAWARAETLGDAGMDLSAFDAFMAHMVGGSAGDA